MRNPIIEHFTDQERNVSILEKVFLMTYEWAIDGQMHARGYLAFRKIRGPTASYFGSTVGDYR